jgi:hypothetical protein
MTAFYYNVNVLGTVSATAFYNSSVAEHKTDIHSAGDALSIVRGAKLYRYRYTLPEQEKSDVSEPGTQEKRLSPECMGFVIGEGYEPPPAYVLGADGRGINLYSMSSVCWKAVQELAAKCDSYEQRIADLERRLADANIN